MELKLGKAPFASQPFWKGMGVICGAAGGNDPLLLWGLPAWLSQPSWLCWHSSTWAGPTLLIPLPWGCRALGWCGVRRDPAAGRWKASQPKGLSSLSRNYPRLSLLQLPVLEMKLNELSTSKLLNSHKGCPGLWVKALTKHFPGLKEENWTNKSTSWRG